MTRVRATVAAGAALLFSLGLAGCGDTNQAVFVLPSSSPSESASTVPSTGSPSPGPSASASASASAVTATPIPDGTKIIIDSPDASSTIQNPVEVQGTASLPNGTVVAVVLDSAGSELGRATTKASANAPDFGHFVVSVPYTGATSGSKGKIKVFGVRADGTTPTWFYFIVIRFG